MAWALRARAPVAVGSLPRATRSAPKAGALRARAPTCAPRVNAHVVSWGEWGCRRRRVLRAAREARCKACFELLPRARVGWHTARTLCCHRLRHARAEHRYGGSWQEGGERAASPPLQGLAPPARRPRAAGAPWEARARATRVQTAGEDLVVGGWWWWWWCAHQLRITSDRLPLIGGSTGTIYLLAPTNINQYLCGKVYVMHHLTLRGSAVTLLIFPLRKQRRSQQRAEG